VVQRLKLTGCQSENIPMLRLTIAFAFLLFISCKKDNNSFSILGKWEQIAYFDANTAWGGCNCWKVIAPGAMSHTVEFKANGAYEIVPTNPLPTIFVVGCSGNYERKNDSTLLWSRCSSSAYETKVSHEGPFLLLEEHAFAGFIIYKYKRIK
jgi:hypothetical protein